MPRIRTVEITHFRGLKHLLWHPTDGVNCLIGRGDSCKSTILEAIGLCLGQRRQTPLLDTDFYNLDVALPLAITVTVGDLTDALQSIEAYGLYLRGYSAADKTTIDEPQDGTEPVLTIQVRAGPDLSPEWSLISDRAAEAGAARDIAWKDRSMLYPARLGSTGWHHFGWSRGSVLNSVSEERPDTVALMAQILRDARSAFGTTAAEHLQDTLRIVNSTARSLGIGVGNDATVLVDVAALSQGGGTLSLHASQGVPLSSLGTGSSRLLIGGLQREAAGGSRIVLIDEVEYGLEPHRIIRLLGSLGAKDTPSPLQVFTTTHSPTVVRELSVAQLYVCDPSPLRHSCIPVDSVPDIQGTVRAHPEALLAPLVLACEGASEVGLVRGLDQFRAARGKASIGAQGVALIDCRGEGSVIVRARALQRLSIEVAMLRDNDVPPDAALETLFTSSGGTIFTWRAGNALEDELFASLSPAAVLAMLDYAATVHSETLVNDHIKTASGNSLDLATCRTDITPEVRTVLARASKSRAVPWFKSVTHMEHIGRSVVGPALESAATSFSEVVNGVFQWAASRAR